MAGTAGGKDCSRDGGDISRRFLHTVDVAVMYFRMIWNAGCAVIDSECDVRADLNR